MMTANSNASHFAPPLKHMHHPALTDPAAVCAWCGKVRTAPRIWKRVERGIECCTHSACPECYQNAIVALHDELSSMKN